MRRGLAGGFAVLGAGLVAMGASPAGAPAQRSNAIVVSQLDVEAGDGEVATFRAATCRRGRGRQIQYGVQARSTDGRYRLTVLFERFRGFRTYPLEYGPDADPWLTITGPDGTYSSLHAPPQRPGGGGGLRFASRGRAVSIGFVPLFNRSLSRGLSVAGAMRCRAPRR